MCCAWTRDCRNKDLESLRTGSSGLHFHLRLSLCSKVPPSASSPEEGVWPPARSLGAASCFSPSACLWCAARVPTADTQMAARPADRRPFWSLCAFPAAHTSGLGWFDPV